MKKNICIPLLFCILFSCVSNVKKNDNVIEKKGIDSLNYFEGHGIWSNAIGIFTDDAQTKMITIYNYKMRNLEKKKISISKIALNTLIEKEVIPKFYYGYQKSEIINYEQQISNGNFEGNYFYEIIDLRKFGKPKIVGRLYHLAIYCNAFSRPSLFISDTTKKNGWFTFREIPFIKDESFYSKEMLTLTEKDFGKFEITTLDKRAKWITGEYKKISTKPYRIIAEEEVEDK
jgi:hypothetical protein